MKTKFALFTLLLAGILLFTRCEDALDVTESFTYETEFVVSSDNATYSNTQLIDMASEVDLIAEYGDKIKDIQIEEVKYWLTAFNGSETQKIVVSTLNVADENGADPVNIATVQDQLLQPLLNTPTPLTVNAAGVDKLANLIQNSPYKFQLSFNNEANAAPLNFTVKFSFTIKMTANPL